MQENYISLFFFHNELLGRAWFGLFDFFFFSYILLMRIKLFCQEQETQF